jgi:hypothetical protein
MRVRTIFFSNSCNDFTSSVLGKKQHVFRTKTATNKQTNKHTYTHTHTHTHTYTHTKLLKRYDVCAYRRWGKVEKIWCKDVAVIDKPNHMTFNVCVKPTGKHAKMCVPEGGVGVEFA